MVGSANTAVEKKESNTSMEKQGTKNGMKNQSPINISREITDHDGKLKASHLKFSYTMGDFKTIERVETGFSCKTDEHCTSVLTAPHLPGVFKLFEFHAHWGSDKHSGSEHLLHGKAFAAEAHFVFWNKAYGEFDKCLTKRDGITVLALLLEEQSDDNAEFTPLIDGLKKSIESNGPVKMSPKFDPLKLLPEKLCYYTYEGSLTTKPFAECVTWTVLKRRSTIGSSQLAVLRKVIERNYRDQQPLNGRRVKSSFKLITKSVL